MNGNRCEGGKKKKRERERGDVINFHIVVKLDDILHITLKKCVIIIIAS